MPEVDTRRLLESMKWDSEKLASYMVGECVAGLKSSNLAPGNVASKLCSICCGDLDSKVRSLAII